ncbi:MAG TPA: hypothetical protein DIS94_07300, partial [Bacteroidetes bacterium]|nr:hypothetical protein [Bacteroidota bacterium]
MKKHFMFISVIIIIFTLLLHRSNAQESQSSQCGNFTFFNKVSGTTFLLEIKSISIPFEGLNRSSISWSQYNRLFLPQNGSTGRLFFQDSVKRDWTNILMHKENLIGPTGTGHYTEMQTGDVDGGLEGCIDDRVIGFGKFIITLSRVGSNEKYSFYWNNLDSKYGMDSWQGQNVYSRDWIFEIRNDLPVNSRLVIGHTGSGTTYLDTILTSDTLSNGEPSKLFTPWKIIYNRETPWAKEFYARTTPFPISLSMASNDTLPRIFTIGTKVLFDSVFNNKDTIGVFDRWGYNTQNDPYYSNTPPLIPPDFYVAGNTYSTPRTYKWIYNQITQTFDQVYGIKLIAESGDSLILNPNKRLFINGQGYDPSNGSPLGDTLQLLTGSRVILKQNAEIFTFNGGIIEYLGGQVVWENQACHRAFDRTSLNFSNGNYTVNNGGFIVIDGNANLNIGENTVMTFDGQNSFLKLDKKSKVNLRNNSKIVFKNGAYLLADSAVFNSINNEHWEGLVFENAGGLTEIKNCTFTNAKNPIKILNDSVSAYSDKKIINNTFNMPSVTGNCIYAQNVFKVLIQNNYFNMSGTTLNQIGLYIRNNYNAGYPSEEAPMPLYQLNILSNSFNAGTIGMALMNNAGIMIPFYVFDNRFIGTSNSYYGIIGKKITGDIKNTKFTNSNINQGIRLDLCDVNLYNNDVKSNYESIRYNGVSTVTMAPIINGINYNWKGGRNKLNSKYASNLMIDYSGLPKLDYGNNCSYPKKWD